MKCAAALGLILLAPTVAIAQVPAGGEFRVNTYTTGYQAISQAAAWKDGYVVVWVTRVAGNPIGVFGQRLAPDGSPIGAEMAISAAGPNQFNPRVATDARGNFVVAWGKQLTVVARLFDASGAPRGPEFEVPIASSGQAVGSVAMAPRGNGFVVAWTSDSHDGGDLGVVARRFDANGVPQGQEFVVNTYTTGRQMGPSVAMDDAGGFVVAWEDQYDDFPIGPIAVKARRFDAAGHPLGGELRVNAPPGPITPANPRVAVGRTGDFVVTWVDSAPGPVWVRRFDASGTATTAPLRVSTAGVDLNSMPDIAMDRGGNFAVTWQESPDIAAVRRFEAAGTPRGGTVHASLSPVAYRPRIASDPSGNLLAVFEVPEPLPPFPPTDLHARRFGGLIPTALAVDTPGNGIFEPGEAVDIRPAWRNVSTASQTVSAGLSALAGPTGAVYATTDAVGAYGTIADGATGACADCYGVSVSSPPTRPATHWDASAIERITPDVQGQVAEWRLHIGESFADVPRTSPFYRFVEAILHSDVTGGCAADRYCPEAPTTRAQMAVFVLVARDGVAPPPACAPPNVFADVPETSPFCPWIEELARRGVVAGCGGGNYCPSAEVAREQMAVFVLRTVAPALSPPPCAPPNLYADVPETSAFCPWIEELTDRGVVTGCGGGNYCPQHVVTREQMSVFLAVSFAMVLYGP